MDRCPACGGETYSYKEYGVMINYTGIFGQGRSGEELTDFGHSRCAPVYCRCDDCGKRLVLADVRGETGKA